MTSSEFDIRADVAIVRAARRGEVPAIEKLAEKLRSVPRILAAHNAKLGRPLNDDDLADLVQDTVVIILEKLDDYAGRAPFEAWIYRICRLELMNGMRRKRRLQRVAVAIEPELLTESVSMAPREYEDVHKALDRVGGVEAEAVRIKHFEGLTFEEIGARIGVSPNTVKTRYYRGLMRLEERLSRQTRDGEESGR